MIERWEMNNDKQKPALEIKPVVTDDPDSLRIYELAMNSVKNLNNYIADFFESINIMMENREILLKKGDITKAEEMLSGMDYIEKKIEEVSRSMEAISETMPELVSYRKSLAEKEK